MWEKILDAGLVPGKSWHSQGVLGGNKRILPSKGHIG